MQLHLNIVHMLHRASSVLQSSWQSSDGLVCLADVGLTTIERIVRLHNWGASLHGIDHNLTCVQLRGVAPVHAMRARLYVLAPHGTCPADVGVLPAPWTSVQQANAVCGHGRAPSKLVHTCIGVWSAKDAFRTRQVATPFQLLGYSAVGGGCKCDCRFCIECKL